MSKHRQIMEVYHEEITRRKPFEQNIIIKELTLSNERIKK